MADFQSSGFSAVDAFFGKDDEGEAVIQPKKKEPSKRQERLGVGAVLKQTKPRDETNLQNAMRVGKRRRNDDDNDDNVDSDDDGESEEEEDARTNIREKPRPKGNQKLVHKASEPKKKKKQAKPPTPAEPTKEAQALESKSAKETQEAESESAKETQEAESNTEFQRRRKKRRSRQKNIRKDNRKQKPDHLVYGSANYQGRELTAETKAKLGLSN